MRSFLRSLAVLGAIALAIPVYLRAQGGNTGAITGTVHDVNGGAIQGAQVDIIKQDTGETVRHVATSSGGTFTVPFLDPATYRVEITSTGFSKFVSVVEVRVTETASLAALLQIGQVSQTVVVEGAAATVDTTSAATGQTISAETVSNLPLSTRNFLTLLTLSAGANTELFNNASLGRGQVTINVNGQRPTNNNYELEGVNANDFNLPVNDHVPLPNPETVEEFKTQTSLYDASQGRNGGGNTQVNLRSGTDQYHGNAYEFFRNTVFNANDWFLNSQGQARPELDQNQFGGSFGGPAPVGKNFFFFLNYQGTREVSAAGGAASGTQFATTIPVLPATRDAATLAADFLGGTGYTAANIDPSALKWLNLPASKCPGFNDGTFCIPSIAGTPGLTNGVVNTAVISRALPGTFDDDQFVVTVDKQVTPADKLTGRVFFSNNNTEEPFGNGATLPFPIALPGSNRFIKVGWTRTIGASMVNSLSLGFTRYIFDQDPDEPVSLSDIGATRTNSSTVPAAYQVDIVGGGAFTLGTGINSVRAGAFNTYVVSDDYSITHGKHLIRFGGEYNKYQLNRTNQYGSRGTVTFADTAAGAFAPTDPALTAFQNFLLGHVDTTAAGAGQFTFHFRDGDPAFYVQDDWRLTKRLTLNLGLRWEGISQSHEATNEMSNFMGNNDGTPGPLVLIHPAGTPTIGTPGVTNCTLLHCMDKKDFAPRVGFAWDAFGNQKTVVRGGFGLYYDRISNQAELDSGGGYPFSENISSAPFAVSPQNPFPSVPPPSAFPLTAPLIVPSLVSFDPTTGTPIFSNGGSPLEQFYFFPSRNLHAPYTEQWNFGIQRELPGRFVLEVRYVGTHGVDLEGTGAPVDPGQICTQASPCTIPSSVASSVTVPAGTPYVVKNTDGSISITGSTLANLDARVPPAYLGLLNSGGFFTTQHGNSIYHALQSVLSHNFSKGFYFQAAYTYSHSIDNGSGSTFTDELDGLTGYGDLLNPSSQRASSDFDRTHRFVLSYNYALPFDRWLHVANSGFTGRLLNGWALNGVTTIQSGTPFTIIDSGACNLEDLDCFNGTNFATLAPGMTLADALTHGSVQSRVNEYVNLSAFVPGGNCVNSQNVVVGPAIGGSCGSYPTAAGAAIGNVPRNAFRGPAQQNWDMSIAKNTRIAERMSLDFRAEAFNLFNHPSFQSPQAGVGQGFSWLGNYGQINLANGSSAITGTVSTPRILQLVLKLNF
jgi:hypothetical protein